MEDWLVLVGALAAGFALGALTIFLAGLWRKRPRKAEEAELVRMEVVSDDEPVTHPFDDHFGVSPNHPHPPRPAAAPAPRSVQARPHLPASTVPTEWAARVTPATPLAPGHTRGACSGCGTMLSASPRRPIRLACPECGNTRLLA